LEEALLGQKRLSTKGGEKKAIRGEAPGKPKRGKKEPGLKDLTQAAP